MRSLPLPLVRRLVPLSGLSESSLQLLLDNSSWPFIGRGQSLLSKNDSTRFYFYLLSGEAKIQCAAGDVIYTAEQKFPMGYGLTDIQLAVALTDCVCLRIEKDLLDRQLCWDHVAAAIELDLSYRDDKDDEASWRLTLLRSNLFLKVPPLNISQIFSRLKPMQVGVGDVILRQGDIGDGCYFIRRGRAAVTRRDATTNADHHLADIGYGRCFGEDALIHDTVRNASITMISDGLLMRLDKADFMLLLREPTVGHIKISELHNAASDGAVILDVRLPEEFDVARIPGAMNAPLSSLPLLLATQLDKQQSFIVYCDTGLRSRAAVSLMQKKEFRARYLLGGLDGMTLQQQLDMLDIVPPSSPLPLVAEAE